MGKITKDGEPNDAVAKARRIAAARRARERQKQDELVTLGEARPRHPSQTSGRNAYLKSVATTKRTIDPTLLALQEYCLNKAVLGFTYRQIAMMSVEELGYQITENKAKRTVEAELTKHKSPLVMEIRRKSDLTLSLLMTKLEAKVNDGDVSAIHEARLIDESRRKLFGADMPQNVRVTGEIEHKLDPAVQEMIEQSKARIQAEQAATIKRLEDPEIVDAEVVDDEPDFKTEPYSEFADETGATDDDVESI